MIRWWLMLAAAGVAVSACTPAWSSPARSASRPVAATGPSTQSPAPGGRGIPPLAGKTGPAILSHVTYPGLGINVSARPPAAPGKLAADAISPAAVLAAFKAQPNASLVRPELRTERPAVMLRTITELHPTARWVRPRVPYPGWVVTYRHVRLVCHGPGSCSKNVRGTFVAIMDAATGRWTDFFSQGTRQQSNTDQQISFRNR